MTVRAETLCELEPAAFQRLALDALCAHLGPGVPLRAFDLAVGRTDGGYDGEILVAYRGLPPPVAVEVKRAPDFAATRTALQNYLKVPRLKGRSIVLVTSASLRKEEVDRLEELGPVVVHHGGEVAQWLRLHPYLASAHGLEGGRSWLRALGASERAMDGAESELYDNERLAVKEALAALGGPATAVLLAADRGAAVEKVLDALIAAIREGGDPSLVPVEVHGIPERWPDAHRAVRDAIGAGAAGMRFLVRDDDTRSLARLVSAVPDRASHAWVVATSTGRAEGLEALFAPHGIATTIVRVRRPSLRELQAWAGVRRNVPEGGHDFERDQAVLDLRRGDLVALWVRDPGLLSSYLAQTLEPEVLQAVTWVGLLDPLDGPTVDALEPALGLQPGAMRCALDVAVRKALLDVDRGAWRPVGRAVGAVGVLASLQEDVLPVAMVQRALGAVDEARAEHAVELLHGLGGDPDEEGAPRRLGASVAASWDDERRRRALGRRPRLFGLTEDLLGWGLREASALGEGRKPLVVEALVGQVHIHPHLVIEAARLLRTFGPPDFVERLSRALVDPTRMPAWAVTRLLLEIRAWFAEPAHTSTEGEPDSRVAMARAVAEVWLAADIEVSRGFETGFEYGRRPWAVRPDVSEAFDAAASVVGTLLRATTHADRDTGWMLLPRLGQPRGPALRPPPDRLADVLSRVLDDALSLAPGLHDLVDRALADWALVSASWLPWARASTRLVAAAVSDDPLLVAFRAFAFSENLVEDREAYVRALEEGGEAKPWTILRRTDGNDLHERPARVAARLVASGAGTAELRALLDATARLQERFATASGRVSLPGQDAVLSEWCRLAPETFEPLVLTHEWKRVAASVRWRFVAATAAVFSDQWAAVLSGDIAPRRGIGVEIARFLRDPSSFSRREALALIRVLQGTVKRPDLMATLHRLAAHHEPTVREEVWSWLVRSVRHYGDLDGRDVEAVVRELLAPPHGLSVLGRVAQARTDGQVELPLASEFDRELLDVLEAHLDLGRETLAEIESANNRWDLRPLMGRLLATRPAAWWRHAAVLLLYGGAEHDAEDLLEGVDVDALVDALMVGPALPERHSHEAAVSDFLVRNLPADRFEREVLRLVEEDPSRASSWLRARGLAHEALEATRCVLPLLSRDAADQLVKDTAGGYGTEGVGLSGVFVVSAFDDAPTAPPRSPVIELYREEGTRLGGVVGQDLVRMAELASRR